MTRLAGLCGTVLFAFALGVSADEPKPKEQPKVPAFERIKKLEGTWVVADKDGKPTDQVASVFKITAAGSAVQETIFPGQAHEMVTLYNLDDNDVILTHYCALGNQPRLKLDSASPKDELVFKFVGGTNLDPAKDMHMHDWSFKFIDDDHIVSSWQGYENGKPQTDHKMVTTLVRKK